jgi:hypothetical protein
MNKSDESPVRLSLILSSLTAANWTRFTEGITSSVLLKRLKSSVQKNNTSLSRIRVTELINDIVNDLGVQLRTSNKMLKT